MVLRRLNVQESDYRPVYVVWELTLACDQPCTHCGSRAGDARPAELGLAQALEVVKSLAAMRAEEVALIGGEAYLHPAFLEILEAIGQAGIRPTMVTGGRGMTAELARAMKARGVYSVSVSIDGLEPTHDLMRAAKGSYRAAMAALRYLKDAGITITANTNINRLNRGDLEALYTELREQGIASWQVQITAPLGRAADRGDLILQPYDYLDLMPRIAALKARAYGDGILIMPGNNMGYFGPEEALLRSTAPEGHDHFRSCLAGRYLMGIESDGAVKGCPSLQTKHYVGGNLKERPLQEIWDHAPELGFTRERGVEALWGFCKSCAYADTCLGGCTFTAEAIMGRPGNNPYCHYRALAQRKAGKRERLVPLSAAPGDPFDNGVFDLVEEPFDAPEPPLAAPGQLVKIRKGRAAPPS